MGLVSTAVVDNMPHMLSCFGLQAGNFLKIHFEGIAIKSSKMQVIKSFQVFCWRETPYYSTGDKLARCLPALHALTGCDTTSKIATKHAVMKAIHNNL